MAPRENHHNKESDDCKIKCLYAVIFVVAAAVLITSGHSVYTGGFATLQHTISEDVTRTADLERREWDMNYAFPGNKRQELRADIAAFRKMIADYYHVPIPDIIDTSWALHFSDPAHAQGVDYIADKFARALIYKKNFTIGVMGNSVMAGHDNCAYDNYQHQLERTLQPILSKQQVNFSIRTAAETGGCGDNSHNQIWCMEMMLGENIDVTHYGWTYHEGEGTINWKELFIRWSLLMPGSPAPNIIDVGCGTGLFTYNDRMNKTLHTYAPFGFNYMCMMGLVFQKLGYKQENVKWGCIGDGVHNTTRYAEQEKSMYEGRVESLGVLMRNWHPGPKLFEVVSDILALYYLEAVERAIDKIDKYESTDQDLTTSSWRLRDSPSLTAKDLPKGHLMEEPWCEHCAPEADEADHSPVCTNFEQPTFGKQQVTVIPMNSTENPFHDQAAGVLGWHFWQEPKFTQLIPEKESKFDKCQFIDRCSAMEHLKGENTGYLTFKFPRITVGRILVCQAYYGPLKMGAQDNAPYGQWLAAHLKNAWINKQPMPKERWVDYQHSKCVQLQSNWSQPLPAGDDHFYLTLDWDQEERILISHIMGV